MLIVNLYDPHFIFSEQGSGNGVRHFRRRNADGNQVDIFFGGITDDLFDFYPSVLCKDLGVNEIDIILHHGRQQASQHRCCNR